MKNLTRVQIRIQIGLAPWIRIHIEVINWIRISSVVEPEPEPEP